MCKPTFIYWVVSTIIIAFCCIDNSNAQCGFVQLDKFENVWVCSRGEVIVFDKNFKRIGSYSSLILGNPEYIDTSDPFRVMVFYKTKQIVVVLNSRASEISNPINLKDKGIDDALLVCKSNNGGFWVFDRLKWEIIHFDSAFNPTGEKIFPENSFTDAIPQYMLEYKGIVYITFKELGISRFDSYGSYRGTIPLNINGFFSITDSTIFYQTGKEILKYIIESKESKPVFIGTTCIPISFQGNLLTFDGSRLAVHKIR